MKEYSEYVLKAEPIGFTDDLGLQGLPYMPHQAESTLADMLV